MFSSPSTLFLRLLFFLKGFLTSIATQHITIHLLAYFCSALKGNRHRRFWETHEMLKFLCSYCKSLEPHGINNYCLILFILARRAPIASLTAALTTSKMHQEGQLNNRSASARVISKKSCQHQWLPVLPSLYLYIILFLYLKLEVHTS
jgi:hypothetical protein